MTSSGFSCATAGAAEQRRSTIASVACSPPRGEGDAPMWGSHPRLPSAGMIRFRFDGFRLAAISARPTPDPPRQAPSIGGRRRTQAHARDSRLPSGDVPPLGLQGTLVPMVEDGCGMQAAAPRPGPSHRRQRPRTIRLRGSVRRPDVRGTPTPRGWAQTHPRRSCRYRHGPPAPDGSVGSDRRRWRTVCRPLVGGPVEPRRQCSESASRWRSPSKLIPAASSRLRPAALASCE